jgi:hypothetical protein
VIPLLLALTILAAPSAAPDEPPDFGRFVVWVRGGDRVAIDLPGLGVPDGLYGPLHARSLLAGAARAHAPRILEFSEVPLPNIPGRLRLFIVRAAVPGGTDLWMLAYFARTGSGPSPSTGAHRLDAWSLVRLRQAGSL